MILDLLRNFIRLLKLPFLAALKPNFSAICSHMPLKFDLKSAQKSSIFSSKASYARGLLNLFKWVLPVGLTLSCYAQGHDDMAHDDAMMHNGMMHDEMAMHGMYGSYPMGRDATGTSWMPSSTQMPGIEHTYQDWLFMIHGFAMAIYDHQGNDSSKFFSENMFMFTAQKDIGNSTFAIRNMISFEPATIGCDGYPLLLQTGETCNGVTPLINRQHPHDFIMELAALYTIRFLDEDSCFAYFGYPGEPAIGPPAFIHRFSAFFNPEAPITHHLLDSTHICFGVATLGYVHSWLKIDASIFNGTEPDPHRWNFDSPKFNSYSGRISINPTDNIAAQISYGFLKKPEQIHPNINTYRTTASISYNKNWNNNNWQTTAAWGRNHNVPGRILNGALLESAIDIHNTHVFFGRAEYAAKDELFIAPSPHANKVFNVGKIDLGYIFEFPLIPYTIWGLGCVGSASFVPKSIRSIYDTPFSYMLFLRIDLGSVTHAHQSEHG